jgi:hypothetical protein
MRHPIKKTGVTYTMVVASPRRVNGHNFTILANSALRKLNNCRIDLEQALARVAALTPDDVSHESRQEVMDLMHSYLTEVNQVIATIHVNGHVPLNFKNWVQAMRQLTGSILTRVPDPATTSGGGRPELH